MGALPFPAHLLPRHPSGPSARPNWQRIDTHRTASRAVAAYAQDPRPHFARPQTEGAERFGPYQRFNPRSEFMMPSWSALEDWVVIVIGLVVLALLVL